MLLKLSSNKLACCVLEYISNFSIEEYFKDMSLSIQYENKDFTIQVPMDIDHVMDTYDPNTNNNCMAEICNFSSFS